MFKNISQKYILTSCAEPATPVPHLALRVKIRHFEFLKYKVNSNNSFMRWKKNGDE